MFVRSRRKSIFALIQLRILQISRRVCFCGHSPPPPAWSPSLQQRPCLHARPSLAFDTGASHAAFGITAGATADAVRVGGRKPSSTAAQGHPAQGAGSDAAGLFWKFWSHLQKCLFDKFLLISFRFLKPQEILVNF